MRSIWVHGLYALYTAHIRSDGYIVGCSKYMLCSGYMVDVVCPGASFSLCGDDVVVVGVSQCR